MPGAYSENDTGRRRKSRRARRRTGRIFFLLLVIAAGLVLLKLGGQGTVHVPVKASLSNINTDFDIDLDAVAASCEARGGSFQPQEDELEELRETADKNAEYREKINFFIDHAASYDETAVHTLILSPEKIDFVLLAPFSESTPAGDWDTDVKKGVIPYFIQYDSRWAFHSYGSSCMGNTACGPTCLAMAAAGLTGNAGYTPDKVADYAAENGYYVPGSGTGWELFTGGAQAFGLMGEQISVDKSAMEESLRDGGVLIASLTPGDFTMAGHFIVIYSSGLGGFRVYDPSSIARSDRAWSFDALQPQIAQVWSLSAA